MVHANSLGLLSGQGVINMRVENFGLPLHNLNQGLVEIDGEL